MRHTVAFSMLALLGPCALNAQAGAAGGAAGGSAAGATGAAGAGARGAAAAQAGPAVPGSNAAAANAAQSPAATYAAGATLGPDPRKPPTARVGALTMRQAIAAAEARNPTLLAAQANLRAVQAQEVQAGVRANPYFTLYGTDLSNSANSATPYAYSAQVSRLFERGEKRRFRLEAARATSGQTRAQLEDTIRQTVLTLKQAFTKMLIAKEALELAQASLKDYRHEVEIARDRYQAGDLGKLDYERLDLQLGSFESDAANDEIALLQASDQMQTLMGVETPDPLFDITGDVIPPVVATTRADLIQQALAKRPDYAAAQAAVTAATANARLAYANGTTDPTLEGEYDRSGTQNSYGVSVNIPLRLFDRNQGNKQTAQHQAEASRLTVAATRNQVVSDVDQAWVGYTRAKALSDRFSEHYLDESEDVLSIAQFAFEHGGIALIDYLDALRDARTSTSDALNAYSATWTSIHQLSAAAASELTP